MIVRYEKGDALDATEDFLLVPVASEAVDATNGFALQVFNALPQTQELLVTVRGLHLGQTLEIERGRVANWPKPYAAILAAMHRREETEGWKDAPFILEGVLARIHERHEGSTLAVAGTPGGGFSGLLGQADGFNILGALNGTKVPITVYQRAPATDSEPQSLAAPLPSDHVAATEPSAMRVSARVIA